MPIVIKLGESTQIRVESFIFQEKSGEKVPRVQIRKWVKDFKSKDEEKWLPTKQGVTLPKEKLKLLQKAIEKEAAKEGGAVISSKTLKEAKKGNGEAKPEKEQAEEVKPEKKAIRFMISAAVPKKASAFKQVMGDADLDYPTLEKAKATTGWGKGTFMSKVLVVKDEPKKFKVLYKYSTKKEKWVKHDSDGAEG